MTFWAISAVTVSPRRRLGLYFDVLDHNVAGDDFAWLPPYGPELNSDEQAWKRPKCDKLANFNPDDVWHLSYTLVDTLREIRGEQAISRSFFDRAGLPL